MNLIYFLIILGIIVLVHEFGHFIMAKLFGVYVFEFAIGMGPKIFEIKGKETSYTIRLLPLGGFVSLAGEEDVEEKSKEIPEDRLLNNKKIYQRFLIMIFGIVNNFILAFLIFFMVFLFRGAPSQSTKILAVEKNSPAYHAGLMKNDTIVGINFDKISTQDDINLIMFLNKKEKLTFVVKRNEKIEFVSVTPEKIKEKINGKEQERYRYGISLNAEKETGFLNAIKNSYLKIKSNVKSMIKVFELLFNGKLGIDAFSGPVGIYNVVKDQGKANGFLGLVVLTAILSINVGFLNLLPIPIFDGGKIFFLLIEKIFNKKVNPKVELTLSLIFVVLLIIFTIYITGVDIWKMIKK
jgi:predicted membrane-associated Zn-dependent proteases 1